MAHVRTRARNLPPRPPTPPAGSHPFSFLFLAGMSVDFQSPATGESLLMVAAKLDHSDCVSVLMDEFSAKTTAANTAGETALHVGSKAGSAATVLSLLAKLGAGASDAKDGSGKTAAELWPSGDWPPTAPESSDGELSDGELSEDGELSDDGGPPAGPAAGAPAAGGGGAGGAGQQPAGSGHFLAMPGGGSNIAIGNPGMGRMPMMPMQQMQNHHRAPPHPPPPARPTHTALATAHTCRPFAAANLAGPPLPSQPPKWKKVDHSLPPAARRPPLALNAGHGVASARLRRPFVVLQPAQPVAAGLHRAVHLSDTCLALVLTLV